MGNLEDKTNNEILMEIKQLEADHDALKLKMMKDYDTLVEIEQRYQKAHEIINKRLRGVE